LGNVHLKDRDVDERTALRWKLRKLVLRTKGGWSQIMAMSHGLVFYDAETSGSSIENVNWGIR
jgi:hypothetical protein